MERLVRNLTKRRAEFTWGREQEESFKKIKDLVKQAPNLVKFSLSKKHRVTAILTALPRKQHYYCKREKDGRQLPICQEHSQMQKEDMHRWKRRH